MSVRSEVEEGKCEERLQGEEIEGDEFLKSVVHAPVRSS